MPSTEAKREAPAADGTLEHLPCADERIVGVGRRLGGGPEAGPGELPVAVDRTEIAEQPPVEGSLTGVVGVLPLLGLKVDGGVQLVPKRASTASAIGRLAAAWR